MSCEHCPHCRVVAEVSTAEEDVRQFWYDQRRGLQGQVAAIEKRFRIGRYQPSAGSFTRESEVEEVATNAP